MKKIVLASNNKHKIKEFNEILDNVEILTLDDIGYYESDFNLVNGNGEVIEPAFNIIKGVLDHDRLNNGTLVTGGIREGYVMFANDYINDKNLELRVVCEDKLIFDDDIRTIKLHS